MRFFVNRADQDPASHSAEVGAADVSRSWLTRPAISRATLVLTALLGAVAAFVVLTRTDDDPISTLLGAWPIVLAAGLLYAVGMVVYSLSWAALFERSENRKLLALSFLISQPVKYLPGGFAQPIGQIALGAQAASATRPVVVAFPVHVLINVVAAITLSVPFLFFSDLPPWIVWIAVLTPILWVSLDRRWMAALLNRLGRFVKLFRVSEDLPEQRHINAAFALALAAHGLMFSSFGVLSASSVPGWSTFQLAVAYGIAWVIGYIAIPAPAGLGAREGVLALLLAGAVSAVNVVKISAVHRIATLVVELTLLALSLVMAKGRLRGSTRPPSDLEVSEADERQ